MDEPVPLRVAIGIAKVLFRVSGPKPTGSASVDHAILGSVLEVVAAEGLAGAVAVSGRIGAYIDEMTLVEPDALTPDECLAFWVNLYNAAAMRLAVEAFEAGAPSVLRVPGAFARPELEVGGESLSLDAIEHAKVRRFGDPRIHAALVCGSLSCPTLPSRPYSGRDLDTELEDQMTRFLRDGGAVGGEEGVVRLNRIFLWYGPDFVRPRRMPSFTPVSKRAVLNAVRPWLPEILKGATSVQFQRYDWSLACSVG